MNQFFYPDSVATAQLLGDVAGALAAWGHAVTVICGGETNARPAAPPPGVEVIRVANRRFARETGSRLASYATFLSSATLAALRVQRPDLVVTLTTPPFASVIGTLLKHAVKSIRHVIWEMDLYPDVAVDLGVVSRGSLVARILTRFADLQRRQADGIIALGECMRDRLQSHGISPERIHICENWADSSVIRPLPLPAGGTLRILYSGNLGLAHDVATIQEAMKKLNGDSRFQFIFCGNGPLRPALETFSTSHQLSNVAFHSHQPRENLSAMLGTSHVGLVTQRAECTGAVVPSKVYGLMAARRPYIFIGPRAATPALLIERFGCGWHVEPHDANRVVSLLDRLSRTPQLVSRAGERAHAAFAQNYDLPAGVARIAQVLGVTQPPPFAAAITEQERTQCIPSSSSY